MSVKSGCESSATQKDGILCVSACVPLCFIYLLSRTRVFAPLLNLMLLHVYTCVCDMEERIREEETERGKEAVPEEEM